MSIRIPQTLNSRIGLRDLRLRTNNTTGMTAMAMKMGEEPNSGTGLGIGQRKDGAGIVALKLAVLLSMSKAAMLAKAGKL